MYNKSLMIFTKGERGNVDFWKSEYGKILCKQMIEMDIFGDKLNYLEQGTYYLHLKNEDNKNHAIEVIRYLKENISSITFIPSNNIK